VEIKQEKGSGQIFLLTTGWPVVTLLTMARRRRCSDAGYVYHVLNRAVGRAQIFEKSADYMAFEKVLRHAREETGMRLLAYVVLPNHWHLVVWPAHDGELSTYLQWLTVTHVRRWHLHHHTEGTGPIYQGRFTEIKGVRLGFSCLRATKQGTF
jgi:REP element-mobilizing transposase RayT